MKRWGTWESPPSVHSINKCGIKDVYIFIYLAFYIPLIQGSTVLTLKALLSIQHTPTSLAQLDLTTMESFILFLKFLPKKDVNHELEAKR